MNTANPRAWVRRVAAKILPACAVDAVRNAHGDWRYPFMLVGWWLAAVLVPRRRVSVGPVSFTLQCDNEITHFRWFLFRDKEPETIRFIDDALRPSGLFFDVGANVGVFSIYAAKRHAGLRVIAFEPEYSNLHYLKENILANDLNRQIEVFSVGLGDGAGLSKLHIQDVRPGAAVHTERKTDISVTAEGYPVIWREGIATATVDDVCAYLGVTPDAMKIDTDGNEIDVLAGAERTLADARLRHIILEKSQDADNAQRCRQVLEAAGFALAWSGAGSTNEIWRR